MKNILRLSNQSMPPRQPDKLLQRMQDNDGITSPTLHPEQEIRALEGGPPHRWHPRTSFRASFTCLVLREESLRARNTDPAKSENCKTRKMMMESDPPLLLSWTVPPHATSTTRKEKLRAPS